MYPTLKAIIRKGKIELLHPVNLPENTTLLVTVLDEDALEMSTLGEHIIAGLEDIINGRVTQVDTLDELDHHLDSLFNES